MEPSEPCFEGGGGGAYEGGTEKLEQISLELFWLLKLILRNFSKPFSQAKIQVAAGEGTLPNFHLSKKKVGKRKGGNESEFHCCNLDFKR